MSITSDAGTRRIDNPASNSPLAQHERLVRWAADHGGHLHSAVQIAYKPDRGYHLIVREGHQIPASSRIASCPIATTLSVLNALSISPFENHGVRFPDAFLRKYELDYNILQHFFLIEQYLLGDQSFWAPYIATLPSIDDTAEFEFATDEDLAWVQGTTVEKSVRDQAQKWQQQYSEAHALLRELQWPTAVQGKYNLQLYKWAAAIFQSRSFASKNLSDTAPAHRAGPTATTEPDHDLLSKLFSGRFAVLLPILDIISHKPLSPTQTQPFPSFVGMQIEDPVADGGELFHDYGSFGNGSLLLAYGFVLEDNAWDFVASSAVLAANPSLEIARTWPQFKEENGRPDQYYIWNLEHDSVRKARYLETSVFSNDLLETTSLLHANDREFSSMEDQQQTLLSTATPTTLDDGRNVLALIAQLLLECMGRADRLRQSDPQVLNPQTVPTNSRQVNAKIYRATQLSIVRAACGLCTFVLLRAMHNQRNSETLHTIQTKLPMYYTTGLADLCTRLQSLTNKNEMFTADAMLNLLPRPMSGYVRSCIDVIEVLRGQNVTASTEHPVSHVDKVRTRFTVILSALHWAFVDGRELRYRLACWVTQLIAYYPMEYERWSSLPESRLSESDEEPETSLMELLTLLPRATQTFGAGSVERVWLREETVCWAWRVVDQEAVRIPVEIEKLVSPESDAEDGSMSLLLYSKRY